MKFAEIIKLSGLDPKDFPNASSIAVKLYDEKDRIIEGKPYFSKNLFAQRPISVVDFCVFLLNLEKENIISMAVKIEPSSVCLLYRTPQAKIFLRH